MDQVSAIRLVRDEFNPSMQEMKALPAEDRNQLASAIARQKGLTAEQCAFPVVEY